MEKSKPKKTKDLDFRKYRDFHDLTFVDIVDKDIGQRYSVCLEPETEEAMFEFMRKYKLTDECFDWYDELDIERILNKYAKDGWKLVNTVHLRDVDQEPCFHFIMEKEVDDEETNKSNQ